MSTEHTRLDTVFSCLFHMLFGFLHVKIVLEYCFEAMFLVFIISSNIIKRTAYVKLRKKPTKQPATLNMFLIFMAEWSKIEYNLLPGTLKDLTGQ